VSALSQRLHAPNAAIVLMFSYDTPQQPPDENK
jgi:hypothetical protein